MPFGKMWGDIARKGLDGPQIGNNEKYKDPTVTKDKDSIQTHPDLTATSSSLILVDT